MVGRWVILITLNLLMFSSIPIMTIADAEEQPIWRTVGIDPLTWTDGPVEEDTPMKDSYYGNAVFEIEVSYVPGHFEDRVDGIVTLELFEQWAPITTQNMIEHIEMGLYDGIFFHRVIDDFVTQSGDPECKAIGAYPITSLQCGEGGTGETIPLEHNENLSHVDGAIGMARSLDPDSADAQWYIAETEAHNLDPENRDDDGYATFGIVRDGMTHIKAIAATPTSDDPTGDEDIQNPASSAGRPVYQAKIISIEMVGVADPDGILWGDFVPETEEANFWVTVMGNTIGLGILIAIPVTIFIMTYAAIDRPKLLNQEEFVLDALIDDEK
ncbi:MAG: peptidylprolyl isomerase [Candidatus Poseidoniaceae archaeon]|nr:peptidylprolyl isomerase [Candidatus Poseidoniaceae archaeon]